MLDIVDMNVIQDAATLYSFLQNVTGASGQVSYVHYMIISFGRQPCIAEKI